jgi:hypothetical protein
MTGTREARKTVRPPQPDRPDMRAARVMPSLFGRRASGGSARVLLRPSMTQRYKMGGRLAGDTPKQRGDIVFDYSNVSEGN